eukprot:377895-Pelagomonas_calceolata.AAC.8
MGRALLKYSEGSQFSKPGGRASVSRLAGLANLDRCVQSVTQRWVRAGAVAASFRALSGTLLQLSCPCRQWDKQGFQHTKQDFGSEVRGWRICCISACNEWRCMTSKGTRGKGMRGKDMRGIASVISHHNCRPVLATGIVPACPRSFLS